MKILLHACCGPCSLEPTRLLREQGARFTIFYSNANIHPGQEYDRRLDTLQNFAEAEGFPLVADTYAVDEWEACAGKIGERLEQLRADAGIENELVQAPNPYPLPALEPGDEAVQQARREAAKLRQARCRACYRLRFERAAAYAAQNGFDAVESTLSVSPFQYTDVIEQELSRAAAQVGIESAFIDYRPYFQAAENRSKALGMYRQNYCGCRFSLDEANQERALRKAARKAAKAARKAAARATQESAASTSTGTSPA